jgi:CheY-like chemotaxis protein
MGFNVKAVVNGQEFLDAVTERDWDLALLDCHMPVMDGYEAVGRLRQHADQRKRELVVIALTASAISGDREKCLDAGMTDYLSKPVRLKVVSSLSDSSSSRSSTDFETAAP